MNGAGDGDGGGGGDRDGGRDGASQLLNLRLESTDVLFLCPL